MVGADFRLYVPLVVPYIIVAPLLGTLTDTPSHVNAVPSYTLLLLVAVAVTVFWVLQA